MSMAFDVGQETAETLLPPLGVGFHVQPGVFESKQVAKTL